MLYWVKLVCVFVCLFVILCVHMQYFSFVKYSLYAFKFLMPLLIFKIT